MGRPKGSGKPKPLTTAEKAARYDKIQAQVRARRESKSEWIITDEDVAILRELLDKHKNK